MILCKFTGMNSKIYTFSKTILRISPLLVILALITTSLFNSCANIIPPTGGPRDTIPPKIISSFPPVYSTEVMPSTIVITFDEFIELDNLQQQFLISPPQEQLPVIRHRGRSITIELKSDLAPNTTYSLNFGNAVLDLNERNPLRNFKYVFSTGKTIDSLTISGMVLSAFENKAQENITVMLYANHYDSVPKKEIPLYVTRTDKDGFFKFSHLRADTFKVFALKDINNNFLYDRPGSEAIAFLYTLVFPSVDDIVSLQPQENLPEEQNEPYQKIQPDILLRLFTEDVETQYIKSATRPEKYRLQLTLNRPSQKTPEVRPLNFFPEKAWKILETSKRNDSLTIWITDSLFYNLDTMQLEVSFFDFRPDTILSLSDTLVFTYITPAETPRHRDQQPATRERLTGLNVQNGEVLEFNKEIFFVNRRPVSSIDTAKITLYETIDTINSSLEFNLSQDLRFPRRYKLIANLNENSDFTITSLPGAFTDVYGNVSDSIKITFKTPEEINYGSLILHLTDVKYPYLIQLLDDNDNVIAEKEITENSTLEFEYLKPQRYKLNAIVDNNKNGKWDTGYYLLGIQPEKVIIHAEPVTIRAAWELELRWNLNDH